MSRENDCDDSRTAALIGAYMVSYLIGGVSKEELSLLLKIEGDVDRSIESIQLNCTRVSQRHLQEIRSQNDTPAV
jgi:hypothetical protein